MMVIDSCGLYCNSRFCCLEQGNYLIIIEGPDGAGKTTLVKRLQEDFPHLPVGERGTTDRKKLYTVTVPDTFRAIKYAVGPYAACRIWDRLFFSEFVYAPVGLPPREPMFTLSQTNFIYRMMVALQNPVILCLPPEKAVLQNVLVEEQMSGVVENIRYIHWKYGQMMSDGSFPPQTVVYDYTRGEREYLALRKQVDQYLDERKGLQW